MCGDAALPPRPQTPSSLQGSRHAAVPDKVSGAGMGHESGAAPQPFAPSQVRNIESRWTVQGHDLLTSTNDEARVQAQHGAPDGTTVWARAQTAGRGRRGRGWSSPKGNLHMSVVLRGVGPRAPQVGFAAALAVADAVDEVCGPARARLKWPNDVLLDGGKLAGLLLEVEQTPEGVATILGIGVNLRHFPLDAGYLATSLHVHGHEIMPEAMLAIVLRALGARLDQWVSRGFNEVRLGWLTRGHRNGDELKINAQGRQIVGTFLDLDDDGSLLALVDDIVERFTAAEIVSY